MCAFDAVKKRSRDLVVNLVVATDGDEELILEHNEVGKLINVRHKKVRYVFEEVGSICLLGIWRRKLHQSYISQS